MRDYWHLSVPRSKELSKLAIETGMKLPDTIYEAAKKGGVDLSEASDEFPFFAAHLMAALLGNYYVMVKQQGSVEHAKLFLESVTANFGVNTTNYLKSVGMDVKFRVTIVEED